MFFNSGESLISSISMKDRHLPQGKVLCFFCRPNQLRQNPNKQLDSVGPSNHLYEKDFARFFTEISFS